MDVSFRGIDLAVAKTTEVPGGFYDMRPGDSFGESGLDRRTTAGFFAAEVDGLMLSGLNVRWPGAVAAYYGAAVEMHDCLAVSMTQVRGSAAHAGEGAVVMENVQAAKALGLS